MSCTTCYDGCGTPISDQCVKYTGPNIPLLGISTGDPLSKLEEMLVDKVTAFAQGNDIVLSDIDLNCPFLEDILGCCKDKTLYNLIQMLIDANCTLRELVAALESSINPNFVFNVSCLSGVPANATRDDILQALINNYCATASTVTTIFSDYVKASQLDSLIASYLAGAGASSQQSAKMVPYVAYEYYGPLSNFDSGGKGLSSAGFNKVYLCNGANGTPDKRGRVAVCVPNLPGGGALDTAVDYTLPANAGTNYSIQQKFGSSNVTLNINQIPAHTHTITDPGHTHSVLYKHGEADQNEPGTYGDLMDMTTPKNSSTTTSSATTGITINSSGLGQSHDNRQPSIAAYFIMYIP